MSCPACLTTAVLRSQLRTSARRAGIHHGSGAKPRWFATASPDPSSKTSSSDPIHSSSNTRSTSPLNGSPSSSRTSSRFSHTLSETRTLALTRLHTLRQQALTHLHRRQADLLIRFGEAGNRISQVTGYGEIEGLKLQVKQKELELQHAREAAKLAKENHVNAMSERATSGREVNDLLSRKSSWLASDVSRFTDLVSTDHTNEQKEREARIDASRAEEAVEKSLGELMRTILDRYHEEQVWSDKIRSLSTYGSLGITALNILIFLLALTLVEPYKRRRMVREVEARIKERDVEHKDAIREDLEELRVLLLQSTGNLASWGTNARSLMPSPVAGDTIQRDQIAEPAQTPAVVEEPAPPVMEALPPAQVSDLSLIEALPSPEPQEKETGAATFPSAASHELALLLDKLKTSDLQTEPQRERYTDRELAYFGAAGAVTGGLVMALLQIIWR